MFPNIDRIPHTACPIWIIHGTHDEVVPFWNGERLFLHIPIQHRAKPFWIDGGGHNDLETFFT
jgi:pimeloyl-ACP methyl ester carboxylesterase